MVPIFAIYILCTTFYSVADIMFVYTLLDGDVAGWCCSVLPWLCCHCHRAVANTPC